MEKPRRLLPSVVWINWKTSDGDLSVSRLIPEDRSRTYGEQLGVFANVRVNGSHLLLWPSTNAARSLKWLKSSVRELLGQWSSLLTHH